MSYPEDKAVETWVKDGITYSIVQHPSMGHYCGYARFPKKPVIESGYDGILTYIPVHGGITYAKPSRSDVASITVGTKSLAISKFDCEIVYGFDCMHAGDDENPKCHDIAWLKAECEKMASYIMIAANHEEKYLLAKTNEEKAKVLDEFHAEVMEKIGVEFDLKDNFGAMINIIGGKL